MNLLNKSIILIFSLSHSVCQCDGFNWYHDFSIDDCNQGDVAVLNQFIINSKKSLNTDMDINFNYKIDPIELGWQLWEEGRLIHWICEDVPSPYYVYNYSCNLSGEIPDNISDLDKIIKLKIQYNNLNGNVPNSICNLDIVNSSNYWFKINHNNLCPPFPDCIRLWNRQQINQTCK